MSKLLQEAISAIDNIKIQEYGDVYKSFSRIADLWSSILGTQVTPVKVGLCMIAFKISREVSFHKDDNLVDMAGYIYCIEKILKSGVTSQ